MQISTYIFDIITSVPFSTWFLSWNIMHNGVLKLHLPIDGTVIGVVDDIAMVVVVNCNDAVTKRT